MPRVNSRGLIAAGIGGSIVSVWTPADPQPTPIAVNAGGACWLDDDRIVYQHGAQIETFDTRNGEIKTVDPQGCYELAAGGGIYAAKFNDGVRISNQPGIRYGGNGVGDVGPDGDVMLKQPDGTFHNTGQVLTSIQALGGGAWSALDRNYRPVCSPDVVNVVPVPGRIYGLRRCGDYALYQAEDGGRVIVQFASRPVGCVVVSGVPAAYRPDLAVVGDRIVVTYATSEGEPPESLRRFSVSIAALTEALSTSQPPIVNPPPAPHPDPKPTPEPSMPVAPNVLSQIRAVFGAHPEINGMKDGERGQLTTLVVQALGGVPWGRKEKIRNSGILSDDALCYRLPDGRFEIYDIQRGFDQTKLDEIPKVPNADIAAWDYKGTFADGENGYFYEVKGSTPAPDPQPKPEPPPPPAPDLSELIRRVSTLEAAVAALKAKPDPVIPPAPDLSPYAKKGDRVTVEGRLSFFGVNRWGGSIDK